MTTNNESKLSLELAWAKVLLKSCLDVLETHNEPIVKRLRNDVSDFLKDDYNLLKNQKKINISEGNVKDDNIKSGKTKHGDFIVKYLEEGSHYKVKEINVMENVAQAKSQDLTEQRKKGDLPTGDYYSIHYDGLEVIGEYVNGLGFVKFEPKKLLAPVPSYEKWQGLNKDIDTITELWKHERSQLNEKIQLIGKLSVQVVDLKNEIKQLKELLKECREYVVNTPVYPQGDDNKQAEIHILVDKINEVLK